MLKNNIKIALYLSIVLHFARKIWARCNRKPSSKDETMRMYKLDPSIARSARILVDRVFTKVSGRPYLGQLDTSTVGLVRQTPGDLDKLLALPNGNKAREFKVPREFSSATFPY